MRRHVKSCRPHLIPACCIAASRASKSSVSGLNALLMPKGESTSNVSGAMAGVSVTVKLLLAVESGAACADKTASRRANACRYMSRFCRATHPAQEQSRNGRSDHKPGTADDSKHTDLNLNALRALLRAAIMSCDRRHTSIVATDGNLRVSRVGKPIVCRIQRNPPVTWVNHPAAGCNGLLITGLTCCCCSSCCTKCSSVEGSNGLENVSVEERSADGIQLRWKQVNVVMQSVRENFLNGAKLKFRNETAGKFFSVVREARLRHRRCAAKTHRAQCPQTGNSPSKSRRELIPLSFAEAGIQSAYSGFFTFTSM